MGVFQKSPHLPGGIGFYDQAFDGAGAVHLQAEAVLAFQSGAHQAGPHVCVAEDQRLKDAQFVIPRRIWLTIRLPLSTAPRMVSPAIKNVRN
jgi:hypothetical protein